MLNDIRFPRLLKNPLAVLLLLVLVASLRFNRNSLILSRPLNDAMYYIANVEKLRGIDPTTFPYKGPFNERILGTTLAAALPFSPLTAINITNLLFLVAGCYFLFRLLKTAGIAENLSWLGVYLFIFSFPTFYYSTIGYIDPSVLACIFCGVWAIYANKPLPYLVAVVAGTMAKENIVILIPVALAYSWSRKQSQWAYLALAASLIVVGINTLMRSRLAEVNDYVVFWEPELFRITHNLTRPNFYISSLLSWGAPLVLCGYYLVKYPKQILENLKEDLPVWAGIATIGAATFYMIIAAFPDGRNVWVSYCFPILMAMKWWQRFGSPFRQTSTIRTSTRNLS
jgi:hypothetical protein